MASPLERLGGTDPLILLTLRSAELSSPLYQLGETRPLVLATATAAADWTPVPAVLSDGAPALWLADGGEGEVSGPLSRLVGTLPL